MNLGMPEMIFIFLMALIIFGPKKLPEIGRQIGKALNEFKRASNEFKAQIESEIVKLDAENVAGQILSPMKIPEATITFSRPEAPKAEPVTSGSVIEEIPPQAPAADPAPVNKAADA